MNSNFEQCSDSTFVKMNRSWQFKFYNAKTVCIVKEIPLLSFFFRDNSFVLYAKHFSLLAKMFGLTTSQNVNNGVIKD